jgi:hypothetical protein
MIALLFLRENIQKSAKSNLPVSDTTTSTEKTMSREELEALWGGETKKGPFEGSMCLELEAQNKVSFRGLDENRNSVRDDIDCLVKELFGSDKESHIAALRYSKALQAMLVGDILYTQEELQDKAYFEMWNEPRVQQFSEVVDCLVGLDDPLYVKLQDKIDLIDYAMTNTPERGNAYAMTLAGSLGGDIEEKYCHRTWMDSVKI